MIQNPHLEGGSFYWPGSDTGVLLLHGFTASTAEVRPLGKFLREQAGFSVAGPLLPGHLTHPSDLNRVSWQDWTAAAGHSLSQLAASCRQVFVAGESAGGLLALYLATRHPEIPAVLTFAPALKFPISNFDRLKLRLFSPFVSHVKKPAGGDDQMPWQGYPVYPLKGFLQLLALQRLVRSRLHQVRQPLLVVLGRLDRSVPLEVGEILIRETASQDKRIIVMEHSSHVILLDREKEFAFAHALEFIRTFQAGRSDP